MATTSDANATQQLDRKYNVLFVAHLGQTEGGADRLLGMMITKLDHAKISPMVLVPKDQSLAKFLEESNIPFLVSPYKAWVGKSNNPIHKLYRLIFNAVALMVLLYRLKSQHFDLIYTNSLYSPMGALLARCLKTRHIWHIREFLEEDFGFQWDFGSERSLNFVDSVSDAIIINSHAVKQKWDPYLTSPQIHVIHSVIPREIGTAPQPRLTYHDPLQLCIVGNISIAKGQQEAIRALALLHERGILARLNIAGRGDDAHIDALRAEAKQLGVDTYISWLGFVEEIETVYDAADVSLICSRSEAFGMVVVEGMARGCVVVATKAGGIPEIIDDGIDGLLYDVGDVTHLVDQVMHATADKARYAQLSVHAIDKAYSKFTIDTHTNEVQTAITSIL